MAMGKVLTLYINLQDKDLDFSLLKGKKFILAVCPSSVNNLTDKDIENINNFLEKGCILGQRGDSGICKYPHTITEPWHENVCLYNPSLDFDEQYDLMLNGKQVLEEVFGKVDVYCPINHLYDVNTVKAAQILKYRYMMDLNLQELSPYENNGLIILPESKEKGDIVYIHYSDLQKKEVKEFIKNNEFVLPNELQTASNPENILLVNEIQKKIRKYEKDLKKLKEKYNLE